MSAEAVQNTPPAGLTGFELMRAEMWIADRFSDLHLFAGVTTRERRLSTLRAYLIAHDAGDHIAVTRKDGTHERWRDVVLTVYGEPLGEAP